MAGAARTKTVAVGFKLGLPFGFESHFSESLFAPLDHRWNAQWALLSFSWLRYPDAPYRSRSLMFPVLWVNLGGHDQTRFRFDSFHAIHTCGFLALVLLRHPTHCQQPCCFRFHQQL